MNYKIICRVLGEILMCLAVLLILPLIAGLCYGESVWCFVITMAVCLLTGFIMTRARPQNEDLCAKDGFTIVGLGWVLLSLFGALPFVISGEIPSYIDAVFETASGFTTTGASILTDIEAMSRGCMFWRMFTHWIGGMGVLVFIMAVLPMNGEHSMHIMRAEVPGPTVGKLVPRVRKTARILYLIYLCMTMLEVLLLKLGGMSFYEALLHSFATAGTGGFSTRAASIAAFDSLYIEMVIAVFMLLFSLNFSLYFLLLLGRLRDVFKNEELRCYLGITLFATVTIGLNIAKQYGGFFKALRYSFFSVMTVSSTTGFATADFAQWPEYSKWMIVLLMLLGACAGSTGGGIKMSRVVILIKAVFADFLSMVHPRRVYRVQFEGRRVDESGVRAVYLFCSLYMLLLMSITLLISFDGYSLATNFTAAASCLSNIGPGLELVGPTGSFAIFSPASKIILSIAMLTGRLEIYPILALFLPSFWKR